MQYMLKEYTEKLRQELAEDEQAITVLNAEDPDDRNYERIAETEGRANTLAHIVPRLEEIERMHSEMLDELGVPPGESFAERLGLLVRAQVRLTYQQQVAIERQRRETEEQH